MKRIKEYSLILLPIGAIILGISSVIFALIIQGESTSHLTENDELRIFFNQQAFVLYIPSTLSSLEGFAFETVVNETQRRTIKLNEFSQTANLALANFPSPVCISFTLPGGNMFSLSECRDITRIRQPVTEYQAFWIDSDTGNMVDVRVLSENKIAGQCQPNVICTIHFTPNSAK